MGLRIAVNASILGEKPTGQGLYTTNVIRELAEIKSSADSLTLFTGFPEALANCDVELVSIPRVVQPSFGRIGGVSRFLWSQSALPAHVRRGKFDVLYNTTHHGLPYRVANTAQVLTIQSDVEVTLRFPSQHRLQHIYFQHFVPFLVNASAAVITNSEYAGHVLERVYGDGGKVYWAYNGYDRDAFQPTADAKDDAILARYGLRSRSFVLTVNASYPHKNTESLLRAVEVLRASGRPIHLCIAGCRRAYVDDVLRRTTDDVRAATTAWSYIPQGDLAALYRSAVCFVLPSLHESFGMPCVEAMASGCPVVVAKASALPEVCADGALYVDPTDPIALSDAVQSIVDNPEVAARLRASGLRRARDFSWRAMAERVYEILHLAVRDQRAGSASSAGFGT